MRKVGRDDFAFDITVSIPQAVGTIAISRTKEELKNTSETVSIPQAVGTIAMKKAKTFRAYVMALFQYRKR